MAPSLYELSTGELLEMVRRLDEPSFRARQLRQWLYRHLAADFDQMTDLPLALRRRLAKRAPLHTVVPVAQARSDDGRATKWLFRLADGQLIETVVMHHGGDGAATERPPDTLPPARHTLCLSTQVGCAMGCVFCATGQMGLVRQLSRGECVEQVVHCARQLAASGQRLSNVVFMGMGEPLANWPATWGTIQTLVAADGFALSPRRITVSTVGLVPGIRRLAAASVPVRLAVSLHAPDDRLRSQLVPANVIYGLEEILEACRDYQARRRQRITFEYVLIDGLNDRPHQARRLAERLRGLSALVNLIPLNPTAAPLRPSSPAAAETFRRELVRNGVKVTLRTGRGLPIQAGCGQLRSRAASGCLGRRLQLATAHHPLDASAGGALDAR